MSMGKAVLYGVVALVVTIAIVVGLMALDTGLTVFGLRLGKHVENARTGVTRSTNQYVTTQQQLLTTFAKEYRRAEKDGDTAQMKLIAEQIDQVAQTLDKQYVSESVNAILAAEGYEVR